MKVAATFLQASLIMIQFGRGLDTPSAISGRAAYYSVRAEGGGRGGITHFVSCIDVQRRDGAPGVFTYHADTVCSERELP